MYDNLNKEKKFNTSELPLEGKERKCTDIVFVVVFIMCTIAALVTCGYGLKNGDLSKIAQPFDQDGTPCGKGKAEQFPLLFFDSPNAVKLSKNTICVKECPEGKDSVLECLPNKAFAR